MSDKVYLVCERVFAQPHLSRGESHNVLGALATRAEADAWAQDMLKRQRPNSNEYPVFELTVGKGSTKAAKPVTVATNWERGRAEDVMKMHRWIDDEK